MSSSNYRRMWKIKRWMFLASVALFLGGCLGPPRAYYYQDDRQYRYYETNSDEILIVSPNGKVGDFTSFIRRREGYPSVNNAGQLIWNEGPIERTSPNVSNVSEPKWFPWGNWPLSPPVSELEEQVPKTAWIPSVDIPTSGTVIWISDKADWDMGGYDIAPETGECRAYSLWVLPPMPAYDPMFKKRPCWNVVWDVPASMLATALSGVLVVFIAFGSINN